MPTLDWLTRPEDENTAANVPYRLLESVPDLSYGDPQTEASGSAWTTAKPTILRFLEMKSMDARTSFLIFLGAREMVHQTTEK